MARVPTRVLDQLSWMESHAPVWQTRAAQLGLTAAQMTALTGAVTTAQEDYAAAFKARQESKALTLTAKSSLATALRLTANAIRDIDATAQNNANPNSVYALAEIDAPAPPTPAAPPGTPTDFKVALLASGAIVLKWKCTNLSSGNVVYFVNRRPIGGDPNAFTLVGATGEREFRDETVPAGNGVVYEIVAQRGQQVGNPATYEVLFGVAGGGGRSVRSVTEVTATVNGNQRKSA